MERRLRGCWQIKQSMLRCLINRCAYDTDLWANDIGKTRCCQLVWVQALMASQHVQVKQVTKVSYPHICKVPAMLANVSSLYFSRPGQFAGALAPPAPPPGFAAQNTTIAPPPPMGMPVYQQPGATPVGQYGGAVPPPPPMMQAYGGMGTPQQPAMQMQQQQMGYPGTPGMGYPGAAGYGMPMGMPQMGMQMGMVQQGAPGVPPPPPGFMTGANSSPMPQR